MSNKLKHISDSQIIDLSSDSDIQKLAKPDEHAGKNLPKSTIRRMTGKSEEILKLIPDSPEFIKGIRTDGFKKESSWFGFAQKKDQKKIETAVEDARAILNAFLENQTRDPRKNLKKYVEKYEQSPHMQAIWAIYLFNTSKDFSENKDVSPMAINRMDEDRLKNLKKALQGMMSSIFSDCITFYYTTWLIQIYNDYLHTLNRMLKYNYSVISQETDKRFEQMVRRVYQGQKKVAAMIIKREELDSFNTMSRAISNSSYAVLNLAPNKIKETITALERTQDRDLDVKVNINNIMTILISVLTLYVRVPTFSQKKLVNRLLSQIPDPDKEMEMRKTVVVLSQYVADYKLAYAAADLNSKRAAMKTVYKYALGIADNQINGEISTKWHANIVLRIGWVAINSQDEVLFQKSEYQQVLKTAYNYLGWIISNNTIPIQGKGKDRSTEEKVRQNLIDKAIQSRSKIVTIGKTVDLDLDSVQK